MKFWHPVLEKWILVGLRGVIYGEQTGASEWKATLVKYLEGEGFTELLNAPSVFVHPGKKASKLLDYEDDGPREEVIVLCHVDDPLIMTRSGEDEDWTHVTIEKEFDTKGRRLLTRDTVIDFLSMRLSLDKEGEVCVDNKDKIEAFLEQEGLSDCNPTALPITDVIVKAIAEGRGEL